MNTENSSVLGEESEDDFDWEEVEVGQPAIAFNDGAQSNGTTVPTLNEYYGGSQDAEAGPSERPHLEITIKTQGKAKGDPKYACVSPATVYVH